MAAAYLAGSAPKAMPPAPPVEPLSLLAGSASVAGGPLLPEQLLPLQASKSPVTSEEAVGKRSFDMEPPGKSHQSNTARLARTGVSLAQMAAGGGGHDLAEFHALGARQTLAHGKDLAGATA